MYFVTQGFIIKLSKYFDDNVLLIFPPDIVTSLDFRAFLESFNELVKIQRYWEFNQYNKEKYLSGNEKSLLLIIILITVQLHNYKKYMKTELLWMYL